VRKDVDLAKFENICGHADAKDAVAWPSRQGAVSAIVALPRYGFVCAAFNVPAGARYFGTSGAGSYNSTSHLALRAGMSTIVGRRIARRSCSVRKPAA
jgi:hypothetical protein